MEELIKAGDKVSVEFNNSMVTLCKAAEVVYVPVSEGDSWIFKDCLNNKTHYVSEGCTVTRLDDPC
jgi:hypothetical protein